jgi:hypothetical protein
MRLEWEIGLLLMAFFWMTGGITGQDHQKFQILFKVQVRVLVRLPLACLRVFFAWLTSTITNTAMPPVMICRLFAHQTNKGLQPNSTEFYELFGNWSQTVTESLKAVTDAGGFTWSNVNCELDPLYGKGCDVTKPGNCTGNDAYQGPAGLYACGLGKTNGSPRANNVKTATIWDGRKGNDQEKGETGKLECAEWLREACDSSSVHGNIPTMLSFTASSTPRRPHPDPAFPALIQDIARFLLVRGPFSWLGYGWEGCITTAPPVVQYDHDYGEPKGRCVETATGSKIFTREWTKAHVEMDCNTFVANITLAGQDQPLV